VNPTPEPERRNRFADRDLASLLREYEEAQVVVGSREDAPPQVRGWAVSHRDAIEQEIRRRLLGVPSADAASDRGLSDEELTEWLEVVGAWDCSDVPTENVVRVLESLEARMDNGSFSIPQWNLTVLAISRLRAEVGRRMGAT
jgi:hypothetical protein